MQQLYLVGHDASSLALQIFTAHNVHPAGFRLLSFNIGNAPRGEALHLLQPPAPPMHNDVPALICLGNETVPVPQVMDRIAAPALRSLIGVRQVALIDRITADMLSSAAFRDALQGCLMRDAAVIVVAEENAVPALQALTPADCQLWMTVPEAPDARQALLETLVTEAALRF